MGSGGGERTSGGVRGLLLAQVDRHDPPHERGVRSHVAGEEHLVPRMDEEGCRVALAREVEDPVRRAHEGLAPDLVHLAEVARVRLEHVSHLHDDRPSEVGDVDPLAVVDAPDLETLRGVGPGPLAACRRQERPPVDVRMGRGPNAVAHLPFDRGVVEAAKQVVPTADHLDEVVLGETQVLGEEPRHLEAQGLHGVEERHGSIAEARDLVGPELAVPVPVMEPLQVLEARPATQSAFDVREDEAVVARPLLVLVLGEHVVAVGEHLLGSVVVAIDPAHRNAMTREGRDTEDREGVPELLARAGVAQIHDRDPGVGGGTTGTLNLSGLCVTHGSPPVAVF